MQEVLDKHYRRLADSYDQFLYYSPEFVRALTRRMIEKLQLAPGDTLADIGCGTGMYSLDILEQVKLENPVIGVDPYREMLEQIPATAPIAPVVDDALSFSQRDAKYNKVLVKETIHHVDDIPQFLRNIHDHLPPGGRILLVHVPPVVKYPLFAAALQRAQGWHADPEELVVQLGRAGFEVERGALDYRHSLPKDHYFNMVKNCYMSVLTSFDEAELAAGLAEMQDKYRDTETLEFIDHFDYLTGIKPAA